MLAITPGPKHVFARLSKEAANITVAPGAGMIPDGDSQSLPGSIKPYKSKDPVKPGPENLLLSSVFV